jgi:hypothetical protein
MVKCKKLTPGGAISILKIWKSKTCERKQEKSHNFRVGKAFLDKIQTQIIHKIKN